MVEITAANGVKYLKSDNLAAVHGFGTRIGGVSVEEHTKGLNLAFGRGDTRECVLQNLELFANAVGFDARRIVSVSQIHSADVRVIIDADAGQGYFGEERFACDGYVTNTSGVTLGIKTADCVPILMEGRKRDCRLRRTRGLARNCRRDSCGVRKKTLRIWRQARERKSRHRSCNMRRVLFGS